VLGKLRNRASGRSLCGVVSQHDSMRSSPFVALLIAAAPGCGPSPTPAEIPPKPVFQIAGPTAQEAAALDTILAHNPTGFVLLCRIMDEQERPVPYGLARLLLPDSAPATEEMGPTTAHDTLADRLFVVSERRGYLLRVHAIGYYTVTVRLPNPPDSFLVVRVWLQPAPINIDELILGDSRGHRAG